MQNVYFLRYCFYFCLYRTANFSWWNPHLSHIDYLKKIGSIDILLYDISVILRVSHTKFGCILSGRTSSGPDILLIFIRIRWKDSNMISEQDMLFSPIGLKLFLGFWYLLKNVAINNLFVSGCVILWLCDCLIMWPLSMYNAVCIISIYLPSNQHQILYK